MAKKPKVAPPIRQNDIIKISEAGSAHAPFLFFERASALGCADSIVRVTLEAIRIYPAHDGPGVTAERIVTAHLRMSIPAAQSLRHAIDSALLLAKPAESDTKN